MARFQGCKIFLFTKKPLVLRGKLLSRSAHSVPGSGHPGSQLTLLLLSNLYWWPGMPQHVSRFIKGCLVCAITEVPRCLPKGKLLPIPISQHP